MSGEENAIGYKKSQPPAPAEILAQRRAARGGPPAHHYGQRSSAPGRDHGNASRSYERYIALAKEATSKGDMIEAENFYQHPEHYFRVMRELNKVMLISLLWLVWHGRVVPL